MRLQDAAFQSLNSHVGRRKDGRVLRKVSLFHIEGERKA